MGGADGSGGRARRPMIQSVEIGLLRAIDRWALFCSVFEVTESHSASARREYRG